MQVSRLFEILYLLLERDDLTATWLAERFEVSTRTIYRDIELLSGAGIPVYTARGRRGGIRLLPGFVLDKSLLSEKEQNEILFALQGLKATSALQDNPVLPRLQTLFQKQNADWIEVDFSRWGSDDEERKKFELLKDAILNMRVISFDYYNADGKKSRRSAEPVKLLFKNMAWYMQGYCQLRDEMRTFKITRMQKVEATDQNFVPRDMPLPPSEGQWSTGPKRKPEEIVIRITGNKAFRVYDEFAASNITPLGDDSLEVRFYYAPQDDSIYEYLLTFGEALEVVSPPSIRNGLRKVAEKMAKKNF